MSLGKRLFIGEAAAAPETPCSTDTADIFGDGSGIALYSLDYDASDASGNYDGIPYSVDFGVDGQINWAGDFNSTGYIDTNLTMPSTTTFGFSCWFKQTSAANAHLVGDFTTSATNPRFRVQITSLGGIDIGIGNGTSMTYSQHPAMTNYLNEWKHILVAVNGTSVIVYIDGTTHSSATHSNSLALGSNNLIIGAYAAGTSSYQNFNGLIDQVRFLTKGSYISAQVTAIHTETACVYTSTTDDNAYQAFNVGYWKLDNNGDDEKNTYDATENSITYEFGRYGQAASFNGTNSYLQVAHNNLFNWTSFNTLSFWVNFDTINSGTNVGIAAKGANSSNFGWYLYKLSSDDKIYFQSYNTSDAASELDSGVVPIAGNWYHICVTGDASTNKIYINGVEKDSASAVTATSTNDNLIFGRFYSNTASNHFEGKIDQIRWFNTALNSTQVANLYNEKQAYITKDASNPFGDSNEVAFYKFENNSNDSTGSYNMTNRNITFSTDSAIGTYSGEFNGASSEGIISSTTTTPIDFSAEDFTISFWAKVDNFTNTVYPLSKWGSNATNDRAILTSIRSTGYEDFSVYEHNGSTYFQMTHSKSLEADRWHHFAYTRNGSTATLYVDGVGESFARTNTIKQTSQDIFIGNAREDTTNWFDGHIDSMRLFSRCLDGDEVFKLYAEVIN